MHTNLVRALAAAAVVAGMLATASPAHAGQPGYIHADTDVYSGPDQKPIKFRAHKGERIDIQCRTSDADGLWWWRVGIRGTTGWVVNAMPDDPFAPDPSCDNRA